MSISFNSDSSSSSPPALEWKFSQVFGDRIPGEDVRDIDAISSIEFDKNGDHLAVGDRGGRVVIFQETGGKDDLVQFTRDQLERLDSVIPKAPKFQYKTEFQSHEPEFDYLKSVEIEEKINKVRWCAASTGSLHVLSSNDKTIKLWKVKDRQVKRVKEMNMSQPVSSDNSLLAENSYINGHNSFIGNGHALEWTENMGNGVASHNGIHKKVTCLEDASVSRCRKVYAHAHDFSINSISVNSDWETFLSGDDLRINLWNLEVSNQCFNIVDMKPVNMEDLIEVITAVEFHPSHCNLLAYSSSRGFIRLVDMRKSALCDHGATIYGICIWTLVQLQQLGFMKTCGLSNALRIFSHGNGTDEVTIEASRNPNRKPQGQTASRPRRSSLSNLARGFYQQGDGRRSENVFAYDFNSKLLHLAWHPTTNLIACAAGSSLLLYHAQV